MSLLLRGHAPLLAGRRVRRRPVDDGVLGRLALAAAASCCSPRNSPSGRGGLRGGFRRLEPLDELFRERRVFLDVDARVGTRFAIALRVPLRRRSQESESFFFRNVLEVRPPVGQGDSYSTVTGAAESWSDQSTRGSQSIS